MRTSGRRTKKYDKKVRGIILDGQQSRFESAVARQVEIEQMVNEIVGFDINRVYYIIFGKEINNLLGKYKNAALDKEIEIKQKKWISRGLNPEKLDQIKYALGVKPRPIWTPFRLDISLLDGEDRLN